jgi:hypothetical protein
MPATSEKQKRFMDAAAHNPKFAKAAGIPVSVAKEFSDASKGTKFGKGASKSRADLQRVNKPTTLHGKMSLMKEGGNTMATKKMAKGGSAGNGITNAKMGAVKTAAPSRDGVATKGKTKGAMVKMSGSKPLGMKKGGKTMAYGGKC